MDSFSVSIPNLRSVGLILVILVTVTSSFLCGEIWGITLNSMRGASLVAQWLRICLLMQETRVRALVWEDPTGHGAAGPVSHSC